MNLTTQHPSWVDTVSSAYQAENKRFAAEWPAKAWTCPWHSSKGNQPCTKRARTVLGPQGTMASTAPAPVPQGQPHAHPTGPFTCTKTGFALALFCQRNVNTNRENAQRGFSSLSSK